MIANDVELQVTLDRIAEFQAQVVRLRQAISNPENYRLSAGGFLSEIENMQHEVNDYLRCTRLIERLQNTSWTCDLRRWLVCPRPPFFATL